jgi:hypothetical protein
VVNYDLPYNVLTLEQRIMRCHRQGQQNDVVILNFLSKSNLADARMLELINKRVLQFDGIIGMSDDVIGNFSENAVDGVTAAFESARHKKDIESEFQSTLAAHEAQNTDKVEEAENVLFTTFTRDIARKITITPQYIKDRTEEINAKLWVLTKWFFEGKSGYTCIDETRTVRVGFQPQKVFTGTSLRRREYSIDDKTLPKSGRHTVCGTLAKNIMNEIFWRGIPDGGAVTVSELDEHCQIGYYRVKVKAKDDFWGGVYYNVFVGKTSGGRRLSDAECRRIMGMPILDFHAESVTYGERDGISKPKSAHELDGMVKIDEFIKRAVADTDEAHREEIECIQDRAYHQKQTLNRNLAVLKNQLVQIESAMSRSDDTSERLDAEKKKAATNRNLRQREQTLFLDGIRLDADAENAVKSITEQANMTAEVKRQFAIQFIGGNRNE